MNKVSDFFIKANWVMLPIMNSPLHWIFSSRLVLLKFTGRKSGKEFVTPVGYSKFGDTFLISLTETHNRLWWRNYLEPWPMQLKHKGTWISGQARWIKPDSAEYQQLFEQIFNRDRFMPKIFKIHDYKRDVGLTAAQLAILRKASSGLVRFETQGAV